MGSQVYIVVSIDGKPGVYSSVYRWEARCVDGPSPRTCAKSTAGRAASTWGPAQGRGSRGGWGGAYRAAHRGKGIHGKRGPSATPNHELTQEAPPNPYIITPSLNRNSPKKRHTISENASNEITRWSGAGWGRCMVQARDSGTRVINKP